MQNTNNEQSSKKVHLEKNYKHFHLPHKFLDLKICTNHSNIAHHTSHLEATTRFSSFSLVPIPFMDWYSSLAKYAGAHRAFCTTATNPVSMSPENSLWIDSIMSFFAICERNSSFVYTRVLERFKDQNRIR